MNLLMEYHQEACNAATQAVKDYIEKHGEPYYCGMAYVKCTGNQRTNPMLKAMVKHGIARKEFQGYIITGVSEHKTQSLDAQDEGVAAYIKVMNKHGFDFLFARSMPL